MQRPFAHLAGLGVYLPSQVVTNQDFATRLETSDQWIVERTGIRERRYASAAEPVPERRTASAKYVHGKTPANAKTGYGIPSVGMRAK